MYQIDTSKILINSGVNVSILDQSTQRFESEKDILAKKLNATEFLLQSKVNKLDSLDQIPMKGEMILKEIKPLYPQIYSCSYSETFIYSDSVKSAKIPVVILFSKETTLKNPDKQKIEEWLKSRLKNDNVKALFEHKI